MSDMVPQKRTIVGLDRAKRSIFIDLGDGDATREEIMHCVGQALDVDAGILVSEVNLERWAPGVPAAGPLKKDAC